MNRSGIFPLFIVTLLSISSSAQAVGDTQKSISILDLNIERESSIGRSIREYYLSGSATMNYVDSFSISTVILSADVTRIGRPVITQNGSNSNEYGLTAKSYYKLSDVSTVWGNAGYDNGKTYDIAFSDVIDYATVGPFVLGDDTGGNIQHQRYSFGGGWCRKFGAWNLGLQANYRAEIAHRAIDPRVRNIVSDLNIEIGGSRILGKQYLLGLNCGLRIYDQDTDVDFYNPITHAMTQVFTGLGTSSSRFKGTNAENSAHKLTGYNASLLLVPTTHGDKFYALIDGGVSSSDLILHSYGNLNFGTTLTKSVRGELTHKFTFNNKFKFFPTLKCHLWNRTATENLFGASSDNYLKIGERENYHHNCYLANINLPLTTLFPQKEISFTLDLSGGFLSDEEYLVEPSRKLKSDFITFGAGLEVIKKINYKWSIGINGSYKARNTMISSAQWASLDFSTPEGAMTLNNYEMSSCNLNSINAGLKISRLIKGMVVTLSAEYAHYGYEKYASGNRFNTNLSLTF